MRKKVDSRIRTLAEVGVSSNRRSMYVIVGDNARDQVVNLHYMLSKLTTKKPSVLWCYKNELGFSSNKAKRGKDVKQAIHSGRHDAALDDPFQLFLDTTPIRFNFYRESEQILGQTYGMCVLQDFEALTPNVLCRTIETVEGGGIVVILLRTMTSLKQLYSTVMDSHKKFKSEDGGDAVEPRFNERFLLSLGACRSCLVMDDEMNVLSLSSETLESLSSENSTSSALAPIEDAELERIKDEVKDSNPIGKVVALTKTVDQAKAILSFGEVISDKNMKHTVSLTAGRGRGKSAAMGLAIGTAVAYGYSNICVTAPSAGNVATLFEFVIKALNALGYSEHSDYSKIAAKSHTHDLQGPLVRINIFRDHRQTIQFLEPQEAAANPGASELLIIDEAAAIPLPIVKKLLEGAQLSLLSSTIQGYEGTGRALALKLIAEMKKRRDKPLKELTLKVPIRYGSGDGIELWLHDLLCLGATEAAPLTGKMVMPADCQLYLINRDTLFSYHEASESFLKKMVSLFVSSHYKNTPNDLLLMSDAPKHHVLALLPPVGTDATSLPDVYVALQVAVEGDISRKSEELSKQRGAVKPSGDMIPWTLSQQFHDTGFGDLNGLRIVRVATHPALDKKGYGSEAIQQLCKWLENKDGNQPSQEEVDTHSERKVKDQSEANLLTEKIKPRKNVKPLLNSVKNLPSLYSNQSIDYIGTSFGLTLGLFNFWRKNSFSPLYVRQTANETTGEYSCVMLRPTAGAQWSNQLLSDFSGRFLRLLGGPFAGVPANLALSIAKASSAAEVPLHLPAITPDNVLEHITRHDIHRLQLYSNNVVDRYVVADLIPVIAEMYLLRRLPGDIGLSPALEALLVAIGIQRKSIETLAFELDGKVEQILAMFQKAVIRITACLNKMLSKKSEAKLNLVSRKLEAGSNIGGDNSNTTLTAAQNEAAQKVKEALVAQKKKLLEEQKVALEQKFSVGNAIPDEAMEGADLSKPLQIRKEKKRPVLDSEGKVKKQKK